MRSAALRFERVVDLSCAYLKEKTEHLKAVLPMLAALRRTTGLPHRIVVDEAHYFLHEPNIKQLLDMELGAYTIVTYRPSDLHPDLLGAIDVVVAKRLTNVHEVQTLLAMAKNANVEPKAVGILRELSTDEAVVATKERQLGRCKLLPRLASHARHRAQYFDFEVVPGQEFVFTDNGKPIDSPARPIFEGVRSVIAGRRSCPPWRLFAMDRKRLLRPSLGIRYSED